MIKALKKVIVFLLINHMTCVCFFFNYLIPNRQYKQTVIQNLLNFILKGGIFFDQSSETKQNHNDTIQ